MSDTKAPGTSLSEALLLVDRAIARIPQLTAFGIGVYYLHCRLGKDVVAAKIAEGQAALYSRPNLRSVAVCADWIKARRRRKTFNPHLTSYVYKHLIEEYREGTGEPESYTPNGAFIAAAVGLGFDFQVTGPNAIFRFSDTAVRHAR
jgi:hypothetical protein